MEANKGINAVFLYPLDHGNSTASAWPPLSNSSNFFQLKIKNFVSPFRDMAQSIEK